MKKNILFGALYIFILILFFGIVHADEHTDGCVQPAKNASFGEQCVYMQCSNGVLKYPNLFGSTIKISFSYISDIDSQTYNTDLTNNDIALIYTKDNNQVKILYGNNVEEETVKKVVGKYSKTFSADPCTGFQGSVNDLQKTAFLITPLASEKECVAEFKEIQTEIDAIEPYYRGSYFTQAEEKELRKMQVADEQKILANNISSGDKEFITEEIRDIKIELIYRRIINISARCTQNTYGAVLELQNAYASFPTEQQEKFKSVYNRYGMYARIKEESLYQIVSLERDCTNIKKYGAEYIALPISTYTTQQKKQLISKKISACELEERSGEIRAEAIKNIDSIATSQNLIADIFVSVSQIGEKAGNRGKSVTLPSMELEAKDVDGNNLLNTNSDYLLIKVNCPQELVRTAKGKVTIIGFLDNAYYTDVTTTDMSSDSRYINATNANTLEAYTRVRLIFASNQHWYRILTVDEQKNVDQFIKERYVAEVKEKYGK